MNTIDLVVLLTLAIMTAWGAWQGAGRQLAQLISWVVAIAAAWYLAAPAGRVLVSLFGVPFSAAFPLAGLLVAIATYVVVRLAFWWPLRQLDRDDDGASDALSTANRVGGGLIGLAKGVVLAWALLSVASLMRAPLARAGYPMPSGSSAMAYASAHNLWSDLLQEKLHRVVEVTQALATRPPDDAREASSREALAEIAADPRVRALADDPELKGALERGEWAVLLQDERVLSLVADDAVVEKLRSALTGTPPAAGTDAP